LSLDSINITLKPIKDAEKRRQKGEILFKEYILTTNSQYHGNIIFYDELEKKIGFVTKYNFEDPKIFKSVVMMLIEYLWTYWSLSNQKNYFGKLL
jgi:HKD family nuclease